MAYRNPVVAENCPDPGVLLDGDTYYMVSTTHVLPAFPIRTSTDLVHWHHDGAFVFTAENKPVWADDHFWAPELHRVGGRYVAYYTARHRGTNRLCVGAATAARPTGPYEDIGRPLVEDTVAVLDPTLFRDNDGRQYVYWKRDASTRSPSGPLLVQEVSPDGLELLGAASEVATNDLRWEGRLIEAPWVVKRRGWYYLFYSGGAYDTPGYALGVARSTSPAGGFEKRGEPVLRTSGRWQGPGHCSVVGYEGRDYVLYHAWEGDRFRDVRPCLLDHVAWGADGWPAVNDGSPSEAG